jgi:hypothetical protein
MNTDGLALNRFRSDVLAHVGEIEAALALGADPRQSVADYVQASFEASLIPAIDSLRSLGIVWIPGLMAGMLLSGSRPIYAAIYQFVVLAMIFAASGLTSLVSTLFSVTGLVVSALVAAAWCVARPRSATARRFLVSVAAAYALASIYFVPYSLARLLSAGYHRFEPDDAPSGVRAVASWGGRLGVERPQLRGQAVVNT